MAVPATTNPENTSTTAHTRGPWHSRPNKVREACFEIEAKILGMPIASVNVRHGLSAEEAEANAHLIAAAPEMLEALQELSNMYSSAWDLVDGGLIMMADSVPRFEAAHAKADVASQKARGGQ